MVDEELTRKLAELSKINFTDEELKLMAKDMVDIIGLMDKVKEFEDKKEKLRDDVCRYEELRKDEVKESFETGKILENAKKVKEDSFVVPKVV